MILVTHDGRFHYDELLATAVLKRIYPESTILRSRDGKIIEIGDIVYDVGRIFDPSIHRYDHHQHTFNETYSSKYTFKLSSSGLIYKYFYVDLFKSFGIENDSKLFELLVEKVYKNYFLPADAIDNGYDIYGEVVPRTIYAIVNDINLEDHLFSEKQTEMFYKALDLVSMDLNNYITNIINSWYNKYIKLSNILKDHNNEILVADEYFSCPLILEIEKIYKKNVEFFIFPSEESYKIRSIPINEKSFELKRGLKKEWRGKSGDELSKLVKGGRFVHANGFVGENETLEGAIDMCKLSLE